MGIRLAAIVFWALGHRARGALRALALAAVLGGGLLVWAPGTAFAQGTGYYVTFAARWCPNYSDVYANRARNNVLESLQNLGADSPYGPNWDAGRGDQIVPSVEDAGTQTLAPTGVCHPITGWTFTMGTAKVPRAVIGAWGSLSVLTNTEYADLGPNQIFPTSIVTQASTSLLDQNAQPTGGTLAGAVTVQLTPEELAEAQDANAPVCGGYVNIPVDQLPQDVCVRGLWVQGGTPTDPVLAQQYGGVATPTYAYAALRCATDNNYGDNVEFVHFPGNTTHVFCYAWYVRPSPPAGTITIKKVVEGAPANQNPSFPFDGTINFGTTPFTLADGQSQTFDRAAGRTWTVTEGTVSSFHLASISCDAPASISGSTAAIPLADGQHVTCTFTNQYGPPPGGLRITKITRGGVGTFGYRVTSTGGGSPRRVTATTLEPNVPVDAVPSLTDLAPGSYRIREIAPSTPDGRWLLRSVVCDGVSEPTTRPVTVTISATAGTVCTFTNGFIPRGSISIGKITQGATGTANFQIVGLSGANTNPEFSQSATTKTEGVEFPAKPASPGLTSTDQLRLGEYRIIEQGPAGDRWSLTGVTCNGVQVPFAQGAILVTLTRSNPHLHCVFTDSFTRKPPPEPAPDPGPDDQPALQSADLVVAKHASTGVATTGDIVTFRITVTNHGPDRASRVILHDQLFGSASFVSIRTDAGRCSSGLPIICRLGTMKPGATAHITVRLRLTGSSRFRDRAVVGTATDDPSLANNVDSATVRLRPSAPPSAPPFTG